VSASGTPPLNYQWRFDEMELSGATNRSLNLTNVQLIDVGGYAVIVTNIAGSVTSRVARLEVDATFTKIMTGPIVNNGGYSFGCALGDYDGDGFIDLFVCNGPPGESTPHDFLFHNNRDGTFNRVTDVAPVSSRRWSTGAAWGDYDNDGNPDLFVTRPTDTALGTNTLYHNEGNGTFTEIRTGLLVTQRMWSHAGIWADFDNDGLIDLFVVNFRVGGSPANDNYLYRNTGDATFDRISFGAKSRLTATRGIPPRPISTMMAGLISSSRKEERPLGRTISCTPTIEPEHSRC
jgi:hypothetical protein